MTEDVKTVRVLVEGRVQGVGFRYFVAREAERRAIGGFVRNLAAGRVELIAQGDPDAVAALCEACGRGPHGARVTPARRNRRERRHALQCFGDSPRRRGRRFLTRRATFRSE